MFSCKWLQSDFRKWLFRTFLLDSHFQNHRDLYCYKNNSRFQSRALNNSAHALFKFDPYAFFRT